MKKIVLLVLMALSFMSIASAVTAEERRDWERHEDRDRYWNDRHRPEHRRDERSWFVWHSPRYVTRYVPGFGYDPYKTYACTSWELVRSHYETEYVRTCYERF